MVWRNKLQITNSKPRKPKDPNYLPHTTQTPITYCGGKARGIRQIATHFRTYLCEMVSPFVGDGCARDLHGEACKRGRNLPATDEGSTDTNSVERNVVGPTTQ